MTTIEKIARIRKVDIANTLIEKEELIIFTTMCNKLVVSTREIDNEGYNWNTQVFSL